jgi:hypothetical protein
MIALAEDCLVFQTSRGESVPLSVEMVSVELVGDTASMFDEEFVRHAANAVFHYFKHDLGKLSVTVAEFAGALEKVLHGFRLGWPEKAPQRPDQPGILTADLARLATELCQSCELFFFPQLREVLRQQLQNSPSMIRFQRLRECVKQLTGCRRWNAECRNLEEQIVGFLRECLSNEAAPASFSLVIE